MNAKIVHHDGCTVFDDREQMKAKPSKKEFSIHSTTNGPGCDEAKPDADGSNHGHRLTPTSWSGIRHPCPALATPMGPVDIGPGACFIEKNDLVRRQTGKFLGELVSTRLNALRLLFYGDVGLFFRVMPSRERTRITVEREIGALARLL